MKRTWISFTILGGLGLLTAIVLTVIEGVKYRVREEQGLDPIYAPDWVAMSTYAGLWLFALAVIALAVTGSVALVQRRRRHIKA
ncbi:hypothetical protein E3O44_15755 [Cryobacterium algoricola]|uniref:LPXTG cell wall anchor domain-containing protein n=1 Tax=Cryobacterium algoricola TaxID=1259183 RepID=A0ABY2I8R5_9MICO|nr:hypothetical protein [Cryobacterium algoricola]TFB84288.1 hypothetical protein E3O44_15755 [Cryobacterium algoricola]